MDDNKIKELINAYFDDELDRSNEAFLFSELSMSETGREYFKQLSKLKTGIDDLMKEFPEELDERILRAINKVPEKKLNLFSGQKIYSSISYTIALFLIIISGYLFMKVSAYEEKVDLLSTQMIFQSKTIQMLFNSLPSVEIRASSDNEIVIKPNI